MGVWGQPIWKGEHSHHPRLHQDSHLTQRDKRSSAAASPAHSIQHKRLQHCQGDHHRVLQDYGIILKDATTTKLWPRNHKLSGNITRSSTNGHRRSLQQQLAQQQRKRKRKEERPSERKRKASRKRIQQLLQQQRKRKRRISHQPREYNVNKEIRFKGASKGKGKNPQNINMKGKGKSKGKGTCYKCGATRPHRKELSSCSVQRRQQWASTVGEWSNAWLVSRPVATRVWSRMVQPGLVTTRIWPRTSTASIVAVTTTSIKHITRHGTVHQCYGKHLRSNNFGPTPRFVPLGMPRFVPRDLPRFVPLLLLLLLLLLLILLLLLLLRLLLLLLLLLLLVLLLLLLLLLRLLRLTTSTNTTTTSTTYLLLLVLLLILLLQTTNTTTTTST